MPREIYSLNTGISQIQNHERKGSSIWTCLGNEGNQTLKMII